MNNIYLIRISFFIILTFFLFSCSKPALKDFDSKKIKKSYTFDLKHTEEKYKEAVKNNKEGDFDDLSMLLLSSLKGDLSFNKSNGGHFTSKNIFNSSVKSLDYFDYKIENDSIIYLKIDDRDSSTEDRYEKSAILLEYGSNYEYFIIKPLTGVHKNFEFKAVEQKD